MKISALRLRGSTYTIGTFVDDVDHVAFRKLIDYLQCVCDPEDEISKEFEFKKMDIKTEYGLHPLWDESDFNGLAAWGLKNGYFVKMDTGKFAFTDKTISLFVKVLKKQNELDKSGFHYCACMFY